MSEPAGRAPRPPVAGEGTGQVAAGARPGAFRGLRALRGPAFRLWMLSQAVSFAGTWMARVALGWLVFRLTGSSFWLGVVTFTSAIPVLVLSPLAGVVADRYPLRRIIALAELGLALLAGSMGLLVYLGLASTTLVLAFALGLGILSAFDTPARQAFVLELAGPADLSSAVAIGTAVVNVARIGGPAVAGFLVARWGEAVCFAIDGASFLVPVAVALVVRPPHERRQGNREPAWTALRSGLAYARRAAHTRTVLPMVAVTSLIGFPFLPMLPAFAGEVLDGGPELLGWLNVAVGLGSVTGALLVANVDLRRHLPARIVVGMGALGLGMLGLGLSRVAWLTLAVLPMAGFGVATQLSATNTFLQLATPDHMRGRVIATYTQTLLGLFPLGALILGGAAEWLGTGPAVAVAGVGVALTALSFSRRVTRLAEAVEREAAAEAGGDPAGP